MSESKFSCCSQSQMRVHYDRNVHTVAHQYPLRQTISLEGCSAFGGKGTELNPIDLVAMGLASCLLIVMGKAAQDANLDIVGTWADVTYELSNYRIAELNVAIKLSKWLEESDRRMLEDASKKCPVFLAIHPDVKVTVNYEFQNKSGPLGIPGPDGEGI